MFTFMLIKSLASSLSERLNRLKSWYTCFMKTFEELLDRLNDDHSQKLEKKFEKDLMNQILYYYEGYELDLDDESFIAVFSSENQAHQLQLTDYQLFASYIDAIPNPNGFNYVLNPLSHAIVFDQSIWSEGGFEVMGQNSNELMFMMQSRDVFKNYEIKEAYLINIKDGLSTYTALILDGIPEQEVRESALISSLQELLEGTSIREIFSLNDKTVQGMVKGLKPYYKR